MLATQCAYLSSEKGGGSLDLPRTHTNTGRKNESTLPRPLPQPKLNGETDSNHSSWKKQVGDRSDPRRDRINSGVCGLVLRSGRQLPSRPQNKVQSRSNTNMNGPGMTCQGRRDNELKRVSGHVGEEYYKTGDSKQDVPRSLHFAREFSGGAIQKIANKHTSLDDDDDDDDDDGGGYFTLPVTEGTMDGLNKPDNIDITAGDQIPREYRMGRGCNQRKATDKVAGRTETHSIVYGSGSEKYTTDHEDLTLPMANLSIPHTKEKANKKKPAAKTCTICLEEISNPKTLDRCGHVFCTDCIEDCFARYKPVCPSCNMVYGVLTGNQPEGTMYVAFSEEHLTGNDTCGMITITYHFPSGTQRADHPNPGAFYRGTTRVSFLPDCQEGRKILGLLRKAFDRKLTFTVGRSTTTGRENVVTWNDISHKTSVEGGPTRFGYPDKTYLTRVKEELASKGVTGSN